MHGGVGIVGLVDPEQVAIAPQKELVCPERDLANEKIPLEAGSKIAGGAHRHVVGLPLKDDLRLR